MKQPSDHYTQELNLEPRQQSDGERAAWLADKIVTGSPEYCNDAADLLRKYSELEIENSKFKRLSSEPVGEVYIKHSHGAFGESENYASFSMRAEDFREGTKFYLGE